MILFCWVLSCATVTAWCTKSALRTSTSGGVSRRADVTKVAERISSHRKKYWRSAGFRRTESSRQTKRSECFFNTANLQKIAELKSMSGLFFLLFNFAHPPAFCQYNVSCSIYNNFKERIVKSSPVGLKISNVVSTKPADKYSLLAEILYLCTDNKISFIFS